MMNDGRPRVAFGWLRQHEQVARYAAAVLVCVTLASWVARVLGSTAHVLAPTPLPFLVPIVVAAALGVILRRDLVALLAIVVFVNVPYFAGTVWDSRDTTATYEVFHVMYGEFYHSGELLLWLPYGTFGQPTEYVTGFYCSGVDFAFILLGKLLGLKNTWLVYCLARLGEQVVFLMGTFLLSRALFARRSTAFLVCLASAGGVAWYWHVFFNLRLIYVFPLALLFLLRFFEERRPEFLWLSGLSCVFAGQSASYLMCIWLFVLLIVTAVLSVRRWEAWRTLLSRSWRNLVPLGLFLVVAGGFLYVSATAADGFVVTKTNRDPQTGKVPLEDYLHHGGNPTLTRVVRDLVSGDIDTNQWDNNFYAGLLPLFFFAWGLARERSARFWAIASAGIALVWLSFGGAFAALTWYLPFMSYYRWLSWAVPLARVLIIVAAGFGFERFWRDTGQWRLLAGLAILFLFALDATAVPFRSVSPLLGLYAAPVALMALVGLLARRHPGSAARLDRVHGLTRLALIVALGVDILTYQYTVQKKLPRLPADDPRVTEMFSVTPIEYQDKRTRQPRGQRAQRAIGLAPVSYPLAAHNFLQWDGCSLGGDEPEYLLMAPAGIHRLLSLREPRDPALLKVIGCKTPKLRLVSHAVYARDDDQAAELIREASELDRVAVLQLGEGTPPPAQGLEGPSGGVQVTAFGSNHIELVADVLDPAGAWLVYADGHHRGWRATVNGQSVPIAKAYLAFKALRLTGGRNVVRLVFWDGLTSALMYALALWSILVDAALLAWLVRLLVVPARGSPAVQGADGA